MSTTSDKPDLTLLTPQEASDAMCGAASPKTLANWRSLGFGPRFVRVGGRIFYRPSDLEEWLHEQTCRSTAER